MKKHKIFLGAQEIAGVMRRIDGAFKDMGYRCDYYCLYEYEFNEYDCSKLPLLKKYRRHTNRIRNTDNLWKKRLWGIMQMFDILHIWFHSLFVYTDFIYIFGHGMFSLNRYLQYVQELEFFVLKLFRKNMIMWLCGADSRPSYCDVDIYGGDIDAMYKDVQCKSKKIRMLEKYMVLIDNTASSHFHTKPYIIYNCLGIPVDESERVKTELHKEGKIRILHAPSNQKAKGTAEIQEILRELKEEGYDFEYIAVHGVPHREVLEQIAQADMVIDQLYCDTPMAGFASEAAINGIPVLVGGYYAEYYHKVKNNPDIPTVFCTPDKLKENIIFLINNKEKRIEIGEKEREYIEENCTAQKVAEKFIRLLEKDIPAAWYFEPQDNDYPYGGGIVKEEMIDNITGLVEKYGEKALGLDKNTILFKKYMELYRGNRKNG